METEAEEVLEGTDSNADLWTGINVLFVGKKDTGSEIVRRKEGLTELPLIKL